MYLKITDAAKAKLDGYITKDDVLILDLDDGVGKYSKVGFCSLDTSFRLLVLDKKQSKEDYKTVILERSLSKTIPRCTWMRI